MDLQNGLNVLGLPPVTATEECPSRSATALMCKPASRHGRCLGLGNSFLWRLSPAALWSLLGTVFDVIC